MGYRVSGALPRTPLGTNPQPPKNEIDLHLQAPIDRRAVDGFLYLFSTGGATFTFKRLRLSHFKRI